MYKAKIMIEILSNFFLYGKIMLEINIQNIVKASLNVCKLHLTSPLAKQKQKLGKEKYQLCKLTFQ